MKRYLAVLAVAAAFVVGCGGGDDSPTPGSPFEGDPPLAVEQSAETQVIPFGRTHTMAGSVDITIKAPVPYTRTEDDRYAQEEIAVGARLEVTVTNHSDQEIDPTKVTGYMSATLNGQTAQELYSVDLRDAPGVLLPEQTTTLDYLIDVPVPGDLVVSVLWLRGYENGGYVYFPDERVRFRGQVAEAAVGTVAKAAPASTAVPEPQYDDEYNLDPDMNVGPDGVCTGTPCGSNGTRPVGPLEGG